MRIFVRQSRGHLPWAGSLELETRKCCWETAMFDPNFDEDDGLPVGQRILLATVLPLLVAAVVGAAWALFLVRPVGGFEPAAGADWGAIFHNIGVVFPLLITTPFVLFLVGMAWTVRWKTQKDALCGGMLRMLLAIGCGAAVVAVLLGFN
jgi:hypothetical protein